MRYLLLYAWGVCLFLAFLGYGKALLRLLVVRDAPWSLSATAGIGLAVAGGGLLNLLHLVTSPVLIGVVATGVGLAILVDWHQLAGFPTTLLSTSTLFAPLLIAIAVPVLGNVRANVETFNYWDDFSAYLTIPAATLQLGSLPFDPFNERRITSCLGAPYVLQSLMLVAGDVRSIRFIDVSIGFILYTGVLIAISRSMGLSVPMRAGLASLALLVPVDRWNATMAVLPAGLFCALFLIQSHPALGNRLSWRRAVLLGITAAALACMKSNYLPAAVFICGIHYLLWFFHRRRAAPLVQGLLCGAVMLLCLLPWMIDMHRKEGTFLFPIFGLGYDASAYGVIPLPNGSHHRAASVSVWVWLTALPMAAPLIIGVGVLAIAFWKRVESAWIAPMAALMLGAVLAIGTVAYSTGSESMGRYSLPFQIPALIIFLGFIFACYGSVQKQTWWLLTSVVTTVLALIVLGYAFGVRHGGYYKYLQDARLTHSTLENWFDMSLEERRIRDLQSHVPPGERILARLWITYPFDFRRNQVFVADYSGMAGLPPGMPLQGGPRAMDDYLLANQIRYLAFDPKRTMLPEGDPGASLADFLQGRKDYGRHGWLYLQIKVTDAVQHTFSELASKCPHIYDDGEVYLLDLQQMRP